MYSLALQTIGIKNIPDPIICDTFSFTKYHDSGFTDVIYRYSM
jgi:hypothetical protein